MALDCYRDLTPVETPTTLIPDVASLARSVATVTADAQWYPPAVRRLLERDMGGVLSVSRGLVLHVEAGNNSPWGWFNRDDVKASSHWWVSKTGVVEQYVPAGRVAWAQAGGNGAWHSVETEGWPNEYLTSAQLDALGGLYRWGSAHWGWPLKLAETPSSTGLGWHGMGGTAWGNHPGCPGNLRLHQRAAILVHAQSPTEPLPTEEDAMTPEQEARFMGAIAALPAAAAAATWKYRPAEDVEQGSMWSVANESYRKLGDIQSPRLAGLASRLGRVEAALSAGGSVAMGDVTEAVVHDALDAAADMAAVARINEHSARILRAGLTRPAVLPPSEAPS